MSENEHEAAVVPLEMCPTCTRPVKRKVPHKWRPWGPAVPVDQLPIEFTPHALKWLDAINVKVTGDAMAVTAYRLASSPPAGREAVLRICAGLGSVPMYIIDDWEKEHGRSSRYGPNA